LFVLNDHKQPMLLLVNPRIKDFIFQLTQL
jgi:hypothetical protein